MVVGDGAARRMEASWFDSISVKLSGGRRWEDLKL